ncbi:hypothetical protein FQR65_LT08510 [Abscondita terminalis]|nr:hypothetical protein FQR65_LT08510 [Abscondita terminalis]
MKSTYIDNEWAITNEEENVQTMSFDYGNDWNSDTCDNVFDISLLKNAGGSLLLKEFTDKHKGGSSNKNLTYIQSKTKGVGCFCTWYDIQDDGKLIQSSSFRHEFYDIVHYRFSMLNPSLIPNEQTDTIELVLHEQTLNDLLKETQDCFEIESSVNNSECAISVIDSESGTDTSCTDLDAETWESDHNSVEDYSEEHNDSFDTLVENLPSTNTRNFSANYQPPSSCEKFVDVKLENYYAVFYDDSWYIGRVIEILDKSTSKVKFLKENLRQFIWPKRDDIQEVRNEYIYYGPIILQGTGPFTLTELLRTSIVNGFKEIKRTLK